MFAVMPAPPVFTFGGGTASTYQPATPSPLGSSSPARAPSSSPPPAAPLSPRDPNTLYGDTQSSPIPTAPAKLFRFAARTPRPNPVVQRREDAQESRRRLFLRNVRQRADEKKWERRGGENELLKLEWWRMDRELRQAKEAEMRDFGADAELIEEAAMLEDAMAGDERPVGEDDMMVDAIAQEEEAELEALLSSMAGNGSGSTRENIERPASEFFSDDEDYDSVFAEFASQQSSEQSSQCMAYSQDAEML